MKVIVVYMSLSGNTKKIAEAIFKEIKEEKEIKELSRIENLEGYDLVFVGFPMHGFGCPEEAQDFLKKHCLGKRIALFVTHGAPEESIELQPWLDVCREAAAGAEVIGMFNCQGELAQDVIDALLASDNPRHREYGRGGHTTFGQPDEARVEKSRVFAREVMGRIKA
jgi:flavodoxin